MVELVFNHLLQELLLITQVAAVEQSELFLLALEDLVVVVMALKEFLEVLLQPMVLQTQAVEVVAAREAQCLIMGGMEGLVLWSFVIPIHTHWPPQQRVLLQSQRLVAIAFINGQAPAQLRFKS
jgi:hypothetical protein